MVWAPAPIDLIPLTEAQAHYREYLLAFRDDLKIGMSIDEVQDLFDQSHLPDEMNFYVYENEAYLTYPYSAYSRAWTLALEFQEGTLSGIKIGTQDNVNKKPPGAPDGIFSEDNQQPWN